VFNAVQVKVFNTNRSVLLGGYRHYLSPNLYALGNIIESICIILLMLYAFDMTVAQMIVRSVFFIRFQGQAEQRQKHPCPVNVKSPSYIHRSRGIGAEEEAAVTS